MEFKGFKFRQKAVTDVILELLERLVESKKKEKKFEVLHFWWGITALSCLLLTGVYIYWTNMLQGGAVISALHSLTSDFFVMIFISIIVVSLIQLKQMKKKYDKAEKEFEALRTEIIDRTSELWMNDELWENRHHVFEIMEKDFGINLYHK